jgi:hypothetical protein
MRRMLPLIEEEEAMSSTLPKIALWSLTLAAAACGLLLANVLPSSVSAPRASVLGVEATVSPFAMMMQAPHNLPVEQYDSH